MKVCYITVYILEYLYYPKQKVLGPILGALLGTLIELHVCE